LGLFSQKKKEKERKIIIKLSRFFMHTKGCKTKVWKMMSLLLAFKKKGKEKEIVVN